MLTMLSMVLSKIVYKEVVDYGKGLQGLKKCWWS